MNTHAPEVQDELYLEQRLERRAELLSDDHLELIAELVRLRKAHGLTQDDIAMRMGTSQPTIAVLERYDSNPTLATLRRYAHAIGAIIKSTVLDDCPAAENRGASTSSLRNLRSKGYFVTDTGISEHDLYADVSDEQVFLGMRAQHPERSQSPSTTSVRPQYAHSK